MAEKEKLIPAFMVWGKRCVEDRLVLYALAELHYEGNAWPDVTTVFMCSGMKPGQPFGQALSRLLNAGLIERMSPGDDGRLGLSERALKLLKDSVLRSRILYLRMEGVLLPGLDLGIKKGAD